MPAKETHAVAEWYDRLSDGYDELYAEEQAAKYELALQFVGLQRFHIAIDAACGSGLFFERLGRTARFVVGVDVSREMLEKAKVPSRDRDVGLIRCDCSRLPLKDGIAGCLFAISLMRAGGQLRQQVLELARVVNDDGLVVGTVFVEDDEGSAMSTIGLEGCGSLRQISSRETLFSGPARCFKNR